MNTIIFKSSADKNYITYQFSGVGINIVLLEVGKLVSIRLVFSGVGIRKLVIYTLNKVSIRLVFSGVGIKILVICFASLSIN